MRLLNARDLVTFLQRSGLEQVPYPRESRIYLPDDTRILCVTPQRFRDKFAMAHPLSPASNVVLVESPVYVKRMSSMLVDIVFSDRLDPLPGFFGEHYALRSKDGGYKLDFIAQSGLRKNYMGPHDHFFLLGERTLESLVV